MKKTEHNFLKRHTKVKDYVDVRLLDPFTLKKSTSFPTSDMLVIMISMKRLTETSLRQSTLKAFLQELWARAI